MQALLKQGQRVVSIGEDICFADQVIRRFGKARQYLFEQHLEPLLGQRQARCQREDLVFELRIEAAKGAPGWLGHCTIAG